jgi:hypothetical protein
MPGKSEHGVWINTASGSILSLGRLRADLYHQSSAASGSDMTFPTRLGLVKALEGAWIARDGDALNLFWMDH